MDQGFDVYCGLDVGKSEHHATALNRAGERLFDKPLPQDEARLRELFMSLQHHGTVLIVVDQPNTIGRAFRGSGPGLRVRSRLPAGSGNAKSSGSVSRKLKN